MSLRILVLGKFLEKTLQDLFREDFILIKLHARKLTEKFSFTYLAPDTPLPKLFIYLSYNVFPLLDSETRLENNLIINA